MRATFHAPVLSLSVLALLLSGCLEEQRYITPEGGGIFAVTYRLDGALDEPDLSVNPLSILAPGFLRGLFGAIAGGKSEAWDPMSDPAWRDSGKPQ